MLKALADRLAEALAETLHLRVRQRHWGYAADEDLSSQDLIAEWLRGHTPGPRLSGLSRPHRKGYPLATAGRGAHDRHLAHGIQGHGAHGGGERPLLLPPTDARYFAVGEIDRDQVVDYAERKDFDLAEMERWLAPNLAYEPGSG